MCPGCRQILSYWILQSMDSQLPPLQLMMLFVLCVDRDSGPGDRQHCQHTPTVQSPPRLISCPQMKLLRMCPLNRQALKLYSTSSRSTNTLRLHKFTLVDRLADRLGKESLSIQNLETSQMLEKLTTESLQELVTTNSY